MAKSGKKQFLVLGLGRFGMSVAKTLFEKGFEVMAVDNNIDKVNDALEYVTHAVKADFADEDALKAIGAGDFDVAVIAISSNSEALIMATLILKELGVEYVIVKAETMLQKKALDKLGADMVVFPERDMGRRVALNLIHDNVFDIMELSKDISIAEIPVPDEWTGKTLIDCDIRRRYGLNVIAIKQGETLEVSYSGDRILNDNEQLVVVGSDVAIEKICRNL